MNVSSAASGTPPAATSITPPPAAASRRCPCPSATASLAGDPAQVQPPPLTQQPHVPSHAGAAPRVRVAQAARKRVAHEGILERLSIHWGQPGGGLLQQQLGVALKEGGEGEEGGPGKEGGSSAETGQGRAGLAAPAHPAVVESNMQGHRKRCATGHPARPCHHTFAM